MDRTGIAPAGDDGGCRWVLVRHGADHVHLVATLARQDGVRPRLSRDFDKLRAVAADWEARLGLLRTARQDATAAPGPTIGETKRADREAAAADRARRRGRDGGRDGGRSSGSQRGGPAAGQGGRTGPASGAGAGTDHGGRARVETPRQRLARAVHAATAGAHDLASFEAALAEVGVQVWRRESTTQPAQVTGLSFSLRGHTTRDGDPIRYGGGKLAPDLTWPKLRARWAGAGEAPADRSTATTPNARPGTRPAVSPAVAAAWQDAEQIVREAAERISTTGMQDPDGTADAVWAAADVLRSLADAVDGDARGPLTAAADDLARAARHTHRQVPGPTDGGLALRHLARTVAMLARRSRRPEDQILALIVSLASLSRTIAVTRTAQERLWQARAAQISADRLAGIRAGDLRPSVAQMAAAQQATPQHWARGRTTDRPAGPVSPPRPGPEPGRSR
jgi:hypothetical protein